MENKVERIVPTKDNGGVWITLGDREYLAPPLNFKALRELIPLIQKMPRDLKGQMPTPEQILSVSEIVHAALRRNYADLTVDDVEERLTFRNCMEVLSAVLDNSGFKPAEPGKQ